VVGAEAAITGALHLDGLADMADGFGGGRDREDVLRIMRDHAIGACGAVALVLFIGLKAAAVAALIERSVSPVYLILACVLARWAAVLMSVLQPYARETEAHRCAGRREFAMATAVTAVPMAYFGWQSIPVGAAAFGITAAMAAYCKRRIGGITGDTMGATVEAVELGVLLMGVVRL
jgi:cobalamin 5'-phosphate synthase/cobalamin synthase